MLLCLDQDYPSSSFHMIATAESGSDPSLLVTIKLQSTAALLVERRHPVLALTAILLQVLESLSTFPFDSLLVFIAARRDAALERLRAHVQAVAGSSLAFLTPIFVVSHEMEEA